MSTKSTGSVSGANDALHQRQGVVKCGYLKKVKTSKKKFFVLRAETPETSARLEYYDSERKFNAGQPPKRAITLKSCFNINRQPDTKHKHVIALFTKDDRFCIAFESDEELEVWLKILLSLQHGEDIGDGETPKPTFEHVWQVTLAKRGLGASLSSDSTSAVYRLCLTDKVLSLIRKDTIEPQIELSLSSIRSCGNLKTYFFLEIGRSSAIGAGELWMETEDTNIAQNVHQTVYHAMSSNYSSREDLGPKDRHRSSSATESSKPTNLAARRQPGPTAPKSLPFAQVNEAMMGCLIHQQIVPHQQPQQQHRIGGVIKPSERRHSVSGPLKKPREYTITAGAVAWSGIVNHQRTRSLPLAQPASSTDHLSHPPRANKRTNPSSKCLSGNNAIRERCDSMPSRARTTSEGNHIPFLGQPRYLLPHRPTSIGSPITPQSAAGSTDSAGSSTSIDDEHWHDTDILGGGGTASSGGRCCSHSMTPDEPIAEENGEDMVDGAQYLLHGGSSCLSYIPRQTHARSDDGYVDMSPSSRNHHAFMSPTASLSSVTSGTPSTDLRFSEYTMDKVSSYLATSEDEGSDRPARAYSFGSRPETGKFRTNHASEAARERAYSFGAKTKKVHNRILPPYGTYQHTGAKSSSAPLLSSYRLQGSHSSLNPLTDDHMELDFSKPIISNTTTSNSGYLDMKPGKTLSGYVEMKPGIPPDPSEIKRKPHQNSLIHKPTRVSSYDANKNQDYVDMTAGTSPGKSETCVQRPREIPSGYMDMDMGRNKRDLRNRPVSSPLSKSPLSPSNPGDYMDMNCNTKHKTSTTTPPVDLAHYSSSPVKSSISPNIFEGSPSSIEYIDVDYPTSNSSNDGYVEMTPGKGVTASSHQRQTSLDGTDVDNSDYTNMSLGSTSSKKRERRNSSKKDKTRSQPIQIQTTTVAPPSLLTMAKGPGSSSPLLYSWAGRKYSTGTSPKMCLPLSSSNYGLYSSLPRQRSRKNSRRDSKDSSTSSATTPSSSSTLFPMSLNSPSSPIKTETPTGTKLPPSMSKFGSNDDYAVMDFCKPNRNTSRSESSDADYVNYNPAKPYQRTQSADYVPINPQTTRTITTAPNLANIHVIPSGSSFLDKLFRPITETNERNSSRRGSYRSLENLRRNEVESPSGTGETTGDKAKSRPDSVSSETGSNLSRPGSTSSELGSTSSTLVGSIPPSVSNDPTRPPSATSSDLQLCYASLELVRSEEDGSRSPRTLKAQSSDGSVNAASGSGDQEQDTAFTYAKIDFVRSGDGFKHNPQLISNTKVKY
ncbi:hypothetical protein Trydic_g19366 [Trypoxylus dichotomus]